MHSTQFHREIRESTITNVIFDACRANEAREPRSIGGFSVTFTPLPNGVEHEAAVCDTTGAVVGLAVVDRFDC